MGRQILIELAYEKDLPMTLADVEPGEGEPVLEQITWLGKTNYGNNDELPEIFAGAVALFQLGVGSFEDCFRQSVVWMRG